LTNNKSHFSQPHHNSLPIQTRQTPQTPQTPQTQQNQTHPNPNNFSAPNTSSPTLVIYSLDSIQDNPIENQIREIITKGKRTNSLLLLWKRVFMTFLALYSPHHEHLIQNCLNLGHIMPHFASYHSSIPNGGSCNEICSEIGQNPKISQRIGRNFGNLSLLYSNFFDIFATSCPSIIDHEFVGLLVQTSWYGVSYDMFLNLPYENPVSRLKLKTFFPFSQNKYKMDPIHYLFPSLSKPSPFDQNGFLRVPSGTNVSIKHLDVLLSVSFWFKSLCLHHIEPLITTALSLQSSLDHGYHCGEEETENLTQNSQGYDENNKSTDPQSNPLHHGEAPTKAPTKTPNERPKTTIYNLLSRFTTIPAPLEIRSFVYDVFVQHNNNVLLKAELHAGVGFSFGPNHIIRKGIHCGNWETEKDQVGDFCDENCEGYFQNNDNINDNDQTKSFSTQTGEFDSIRLLSTLSQDELHNAKLFQSSRPFYQFLFYLSGLQLQNFLILNPFLPFFSSFFQKIGFSTHSSPEFFSQLTFFISDIIFRSLQRLLPTSFPDFAHSLTILPTNHANSMQSNDFTSCNEAQNDFKGLIFNFFSKYPLVSLLLQLPPPQSLSLLTILFSFPLPRQSIYSMHFSMLKEMLNDGKSWVKNEMNENKHNDEINQPNEPNKNNNDPARSTHILSSSSSHLQNGNNYPKIGGVLMYLLPFSLNNLTQFTKGSSAENLAQNSTNVPKNLLQKIIILLKMSYEYWIPPNLNEQDNFFDSNPNNPQKSPRNKALDYIKPTHYLTLNECQQCIHQLLGDVKINMTTILNLFSKIQNYKSKHFEQFEQMSAQVDQFNQNVQNNNNYFFQNNNIDVSTNGLNSDTLFTVPFTFYLINPFYSTRQTSHHDEVNLNSLQNDQNNNHHFDQSKEENNNHHILENNNFSSQIAPLPSQSRFIEHTSTLTIDPTTASNLFKPEVEFLKKQIQNLIIDLLSQNEHKSNAAKQLLEERYQHILRQQIHLQENPFDSVMFTFNNSLIDMCQLSILLDC
jgi:hypothetical protein